ncbi:coproporphyrinogen III oxidase [Alteribacillus iranensis]|uniref:Oxygen-independent coproporphyrinogen-3 oxidase n=1 Tax=Alteribacillus iranensis TaxID=930128 RepID=A0A1I1Z3F7_9BACI|nr:coproporphyrinogen III oxidase [Alteribacillus iranensis]SFE26295.1 oxygen-independent coproporphyrinogen-3 oxidase [Alteribacillus iranensis]
MRIHIKGALEKELQSMQHIVDLYNMSATLHLEPESESTVSITFSEEEKSNYLNVTGVFDHKHGEKVVKSFQKHAPAMATEKDRVALAKQARAHVLVLILNEWTNTKQPWGTLTGIRPVKLWHKLYQEGMSSDNIHRYLVNEFLVSDEKANLVRSIAKRQQQVLPDLYALAEGVSIYIGIPFCPTKCAYCTFPAYAIPGKNGPVATFLKGLHYEMEEIGGYLKRNNIPVTTIYFGGGTPTSISAEEMDQLYAKMYEVIPMERVREVTVEAGRPDTITPDKLQVLRKWNIDRISINPQTFENQTLETIGRHHSVEETIKKYHLSREMGMKNINMDLIIGLPNEGVPEMERTLQETKSLMPESLTVHTLSFKRASKMTKEKEKYQVADGNEVSKMMGLTADWMEENEYYPYYLYRQKNILGNLENIGYSMEGKESLYNIIIMEEVQTILGLGCGAASKYVDPHTKKITRYANPKDPVSYKNRYKECTDKKLMALNNIYTNKAVPK